jgi:hypothetical protein
MRRIFAWAGRHRVWAFVIAVLVLAVIVGGLNSGSNPKTDNAAAAGSPTSAAPAPSLAISLLPASPSPAKPSPAAPTTHAAPKTSKPASRPASPSPSASTCDLPDNQDLIERDDDPQAQILAAEFGEADLGNCTATLDTFMQEAGQAPGECTTIAWASDNPGYDVNQIPAPPLKKVIESAGPGC